MSLLTGKEIKNVAQPTGFAFIKLTITTVCTRDNRKLFVLYIKNFGKSAAGSPHHVSFITRIAAFGAFVLNFILHFQAFLNLDVKLKN